MRIRRSQEVAFRRLGDECLLVPIRTHPQQEMAIFRLNEVGAFLWQALGEPESEERLAQRLADAFDVDLPQATGDLRAFVALLLGKGLIEQVDP